MQDEQEYQPDEQEQPLDFSRRTPISRCPYCGETLSSEELKDLVRPGANSFICPNCRKRLNIHELGSGL